MFPQDHNPASKGYVDQHAGSFEDIPPEIPEGPL